jgi:hypothetical protein
MKTYGEWVYRSTVFDLGTRWMWEMFHFPATLSLDKYHAVSIGYEAVGTRKPFTVGNVRVEHCSASRDRHWQTKESQSFRTTWHPAEKNNSKEISLRLMLFLYSDTGTLLADRRLQFSYGARRLTSLRTGLGDNLFTNWKKKQSGVFFRTAGFD